MISAWHHTMNSRRIQHARLTLHLAPELPSAHGHRSLTHERWHILSVHTSTHNAHSAGMAGTHTDQQSCATGLTPTQVSVRALCFCTSAF
jgi:hypothetical protein